MISKIEKVYSRPRTSIDSDIYLVGEIGAPEDYIDEFQTMRESGEQDEINIYINSPGGRVDTALQFINIMRNCKGKVTCIIEGICHSAATYIFLSADQWIVNHNCLMMIHNYSGGAFGKGGELVQNVMANDKWVRSLMATIYEVFITEEELESVNLNQDIWLGSEEINERLNGVVALREQKALEHEDSLRESTMKLIQEYQEDDKQDSKDLQGSPEE